MNTAFKGISVIITKQERFFMKSFERIFPAVLFLIVIGFLLGCIAPPAQEPPMKDCGTNKECFEEAAKVCERAKVVLEEQQENLDLKMYGESRGQKEEDCDFYFKIELVEFKFEQEPRNEFEKKTMDDFLAAIKALEGKELVCKIPGERLRDSSVFTEIKGEKLKEYCSGSFITILEELQEKFA